MNNGYVKLMVFGKEIGKVLTDGRADMHTLIYLAGGIWSEEGHCWTTCEYNTADSDYWYNTDDVEIVKANDDE